MQKLNISNDDLKKIINLIPNPIYILKKVENDVIFYDYNIAAEELNEGIIEDIIGSNILKFFYENSEILKAFKTKIDESDILPKDTKIKLKSIGKEKVLNVNYKLISANLIMIYVKNIEIQKKLEESLEKFDYDKLFILNYIPEFIIFQDKEHNVL